MTGLMLKDFLGARKSFRYFFLLLLIYAAAALFGGFSPTMFASMTMLVTLMLPTAFFGQDGQANWDAYGRALPVSVAGTVGARYLSAALGSLAGAALALVMGAALSLTGRMDDLGGYGLSVVVLWAVVLLYSAVAMPVMYRLGPERGRVAACLIVGAVVGSSVALGLFTSTGVGLSAAVLPVLAPAMAAAALLAMGGSFALSCAIYRRQAG